MYPNPTFYINPIRQPNTNLIQNLGIGANTKKIPIKANVNESNKVIDKRIQRLNLDKDKLKQLLKEKEQTELETIKKIEYERIKREKTQLNLVRNDILELKNQLMEKNNLYNQIVNFHQKEKENNLKENLDYIEKSKTILNQNLSINEKKIIQLKEEELHQQQLLREQEIIKKYEKDKKDLEIKEINKKKEEILNRKKEEMNKRINELRLKFIKQNVDDIKTDLKYREIEESLLQNEKNNNINYNGKPDENDTNIQTHFLKREFMENMKSQQPSKEIDPLKIVLENLTKSQENPNLGDTEEKKDKINLVKKLIEELYPNKTLEDLQNNQKNISNYNLKNDTLLPSAISQEEINKQNKEKQRKKEIIKNLPNLINANEDDDQLYSLLKEDEDTQEEFIDILGKINKVDSALSYF